MYVANLDRPWTETPFMFQGFELHDQREIDELQSHTRHVYVIVPDEKIELTARASDKPFLSTNSDLLNQSSYRKTVHIDKEIHRARQNHTAFIKLFNELESYIRTNGN